MMSQNRQDRLKAHNDYLLDLKTEEESKAVLEMLAAQNNALLEIYQELLELKRGRRQITATTIEKSGSPEKLSSSKRGLSCDPIAESFDLGLVHAVLGNNHDLIAIALQSVDQIPKLAHGHFDLLGQVRHLQDDYFG